MAAQPEKDFLRTQQKMDVALRRILIDAALDTARKILRLASTPGIGARTREAQLALFLEYLKEEQTDLWVNTIQPLIEQYYPKAAATADSAATVIDDVLRAAVGEKSAEFLLDSIKIQARIAQQFDLSTRGNSLSGKVWKNVQVNVARIQRLIQNHLITGSVNPRELANDVKKFIEPSTPGGVSYAAMRLARTEINNAFHDRQKSIAKERPWVTGAKWNLSLTHVGPDVCDDLSRGHSKGLGKGIYSKDEIPDKPHPHCLCYLTYQLPSERDMTNLLRAELGKAPLIRSA